MDTELKKKVARYLFPYIGNGCYRNDTYYDTLVKEYGKKAVLEATQEESQSGSISDTFTYH